MSEKPKPDDETKEEAAADEEDKTVQNPRVVRIDEEHIKIGHGLYGEIVLVNDYTGMES